MIISNKYKKVDTFKCSITIETALSFTLMMLILFTCMGPIFMCKTSASFMLNIDKITKDFSYIKTIENEQSIKDLTRIKENKEYKGDVDIEINNINEGINNLLNHAIVKTILLKDNDDRDNPFCNIDYIKPVSFDIYDEDTGVIKYDYNVSFKEPLNILKIRNIDNRFLSYRRPFIGSDGNRQRYSVSTLSEAGYYTADDYKIYHIYHTYRDCYRLEKEIFKKTYEEVRGDKEPCQRCLKGINNYENLDLYITATGKRFHKDPRCFSMTAIVTERNEEFIKDNNLNKCSICENRDKGGGG